MPQSVKSMIQSTTQFYYKHKFSRQELQNLSTHILSLSQIIKQKHMQASSSSILMKHNNQYSQDEIVLFKFKRAYRQESFDQIKIHSKKIKPNPESTQKAVQEYKKRHFIDREAMLTQMFQKLQLKNTQSQPTQKHNKAIEQQKKSSYFLKRYNHVQITYRINSSQHQSEQPSSLITNEEVKIQATRIRSQIRKQSLHQRLNKNRGIVPTSSQTQKRRVKYKIIDIRQQNFVQLNGQKVEYEDLSKEYSEKEKEMNGTVYDYYILRKGTATVTTNYQPAIILPEEAQYLLEEQENQPMNQQSGANSSDDSNREDRSDYDYPEQDYHEGDSDNQSEGLIGGDRDNDYDDYDDGDDLRNDFRQQDEEEYYRQYLRRCKRKQKGDDQITYLYNMKPAKYENDSDQY